LAWKKRQRSSSFIQQKKTKTIKLPARKCVMSVAVVSV